eukprot:6072335-Pleurochrysis_carterae.AAC.1
MGWRVGIEGGRGEEEGGGQRKVAAKAKGSGLGRANILHHLKKVKDNGFGRKEMWWRASEKPREGVARLRCVHLDSAQLLLLLGDRSVRLGDLGLFFDDVRL